MVKYYELNRSSIGSKYVEMTREQFHAAKRDPARWFIGFGNCYLECSRSEYAAHHREREHHKYLLTDTNDNIVTPLSYECDLFEGAADPCEVPIDEMIIATSTIALQEQLAKDVRTVMLMLDIEVPVTVAKGMKNFACMKRISTLFRRNRKDPFIQKLWKACYDGNQDRAAIPLYIKETEWERMCVVNYGGKQCPNCNCTSNCQYRKMRSQIMRSGGIVICHHNMLISHTIQMQKTGKGIFHPDNGTLIVDEAHHLEAAFREAFTQSFSKKEMIRMVNCCAEKREENKTFIQQTKADLQMLFRILNEQIREQQEESDGDLQAFYLHHSKQLDKLLQRLKAHVVRVEHENELSGLYFFLHKIYHSPPDQLIWLEKTPDTRICICPRDISERIAKLLYRQGRSTILTSATISGQREGTPRQQCKYFLDSVGFPMTAKVSEPKRSPYDYDANTRLYLSKALPVPSPERRKKYRDAAIPEIVRLLRITNGKTLILFTAKSDMDYVYQRLCSRKLPYQILIQNNASTQEQQLTRFRENTDSVILGSGTYWEGINIKGESLSQVIIFKLPFPAPDPIMDDKMAMAADAVYDVLIPEMLTKLRQGVGRLIRSSTDCGIVSILDPRLNSVSGRGYAQNVLNALPMKYRTEDIRELVAFWNTISEERRKTD